MFSDLDSTLLALISAAPSTLVQLDQAEVLFDTPEKDFPNNHGSVLSLFLHEVRENRDLRDPVPSYLNVGNLQVRRRAPIRVDCAYLVTAWATAPDKVKTEHQLLAQAFAWLSRFPVVPQDYLAGSLVGQAFAPPSAVTQWDNARNLGEFWSALGFPPRPYFNLIVTVAMDLGQAVEDAIVTTIASQYHAEDPASTEERLIVGGTVRDHNQQPVPDAWVRLEPRGDTTVTNALGRFVFDHAPRGAGHTLRARATGFVNEALRTNLRVPSPSGEYDLNFPPNPP